MTLTIRTPAQQQAEILMPLARHLATHPDLAAVDVSPVLTDTNEPDQVSARCHLSFYGTNRVGALLDWVNSLADVTVMAQVVPGHWLDADVTVRGALPDGQHYIEVWAAVPGFSTAFNLLDRTDPDQQVAIRPQALSDYRSPLAGELLAPPDEAPQPATDPPDDVEDQAAEQDT